MKNIILAALATLTLAACGGGSNPRVYLIAIDPQTNARGSLPTSCTGDQVSSFKDVYTNLRAGSEWEVWDGVDGKQYLNIGSTFGTGTDLIEGDGKAFNGQLVSTYVDPDKSANTYTDTRSVNVTFDELGSSARGSVAISDSRTCAGADATFCEGGAQKPYQCARGAMPIVGRQISVQNIKEH